MPNNPKPSASSFVVPAIAPFVAAAIVPWAIFSMIPFSDRVSYDYPGAQLMAVVLVPFVGVGLCTAAAFLTDSTKAPVKRVFLAFASGAGGVVTLWMSDQMLILVRLDVIAFLWSALLAVWVVALLRSLMRRRMNTSHAVLHEGDHRPTTSAV
ncbi:hypothetical protein [Tessaracoccus antarcticus]|uniref:Uncharacterized protein n=1 Tax=Tessaracoccus antarcticus TaxID=2479848 RepID=A0A3M0GQV4_9ACTN|nr:hypothetical protein [Tessaracoccus antarcticus]RMB59666.1 hypothetical protein EAX62_07840 [Tessaracoccus antarcticus]